MSSTMSKRRFASVTGAQTRRRAPVDAPGRKPHLPRVRAGRRSVAGHPRGRPSADPGGIHAVAGVFQSYGNILTNTAFLHGLAAEELTDGEFAATDPYFPAITGVRARKSDAPERAAARGVVLLYHRLDDVIDVHDVAVPAGLFGSTSSGSRRTAR